MTLLEQYNQNLKYIEDLQRKKSKTEGSIETRNNEIARVRTEISDLSRTLKTEYGLDPKNLSSKIDELKKEFNDNTQLIKENLEKLEDTDEWISWSKT